MLHAGLDAASHTKRGVGRGVSTAAVLRGKARHMARLLAHDFHVFDARARVFGGDVATTEILDEATELGEERRAIKRLAGAHDHALATTVRKAGDRGLVGHPACETKGIHQGELFMRVGDEARATECGPKTRIVDRHNRCQA